MFGASANTISPTTISALVLARRGLKWDHRCMYVLSNSRKLLCCDSKPNILHLTETGHYIADVDVAEAVIASRWGIWLYRRQTFHIFMMFRVCDMFDSYFAFRNLCLHPTVQRQPFNILFWRVVPIRVRFCPENQQLQQLDQSYRTRANYYFHGTSKYVSEWSNHQEKTNYPSKIVWEIYENVLLQNNRKFFVLRFHRCQFEDLSSLIRVSRIDCADSLEEVRTR